MEGIVIKDLWRIDYASDIESTNINFRMLLIILMPFKFFTAMLLVVVGLGWMFSFFGVFFIIDDICQNQSMSLYSYLILTVDFLVLFFYVRSLILDK